jgi:hypothetical protein
VRDGSGSSAPAPLQQVLQEEALKLRDLMQRLKSMMVEPTND